VCRDYPRTLDVTEAIILGLDSICDCWHRFWQNHAIYDAALDGSHEKDYHHLATQGFAIESSM